MEKNKKVVIRNVTAGPILVTVPQIPFRHEWLGQDATYAIEADKLEELMYDTGFKYMIDTGMLYIDDMEDKKELGLEPEDATEPVNIIVLSDKDRRRYMVNLSQAEFEKKVKELSMEQINLLIDYAIEHRLADFDKAMFLQKITGDDKNPGRDIITAIKLGDQAKEG